MEARDLKDSSTLCIAREVEELRDRVLRMGGLVESQLLNAIQAVVRGDSSLGLRVARDDYKVNACEVGIDEQCSRLLSSQLEDATDVRLIIAIIKTITDLERIGDEAEKIGYLASQLAAMERPHDSYQELRALGQHVAHMVRDAMNAFARLEGQEALEIVRRDEKADEEYNTIVRHCIASMTEDPRAVERIMNVTWAARSLERIGDHAKNICEYVIYMVHGRDIRHTQGSEFSGLGAD